MSAEPTMTMCGGDLDAVKKIANTRGAGDAMTEIMRSRGALLDFALAVTAAKDAPEWLREAAQAALKDAPIRDQ